MKKRISIYLPLMLLFSLNACQKVRNSVEPQFKYYNFCPDGQKLLMTVDGWIYSADGVDYRADPGYYVKYPYNNTGTQNLRIKDKTLPPTYLETSVHLQNYYTYAVFTAGSIYDIDHLVLPVYAESSSKCKVRVVNLCPDCDTIQLTMNGVNYTGKIPYLAASDYVNVSPDSVTAEVRKTDNTYIATERSLRLLPYRTMDIVVSGYKGSSNPTYTPVITAVKEN